MDLNAFNDARFPRFRFVSLFDIHRVGGGRHFQIEAAQIGHVLDQSHDQIRSDERHVRQFQFLQSLSGRADDNNKKKGSISRFR